MQRVAVIVGGTGLVGHHLVTTLRAAGWRVVPLVRRSTDDADARVVDLAALTAADIPADATAGFCALGTTIRVAGSQEAFRHVDHDLVVGFARACAQRGVAAMHVVSSMGADPASRVFYNRVKGDMERDVAAVGIRATHFYRPSLLLGERSEFRLGERIGSVAMRLARPLLPRDMRAIPAASVARAMAQNAERPAPGVHVHLSGKMAR